MTNRSVGLSIRTKEECKWDLISLGEVMLRFDPGEERIASARSFRVWEGGGEYNVARGLRRCFGLRSSIVTALADNPVGRLIEDLMLQGGVDLSHLRWADYDGIGREARNGIYFLERGFGVRGATGMMDRGHTPISQLQPGQIDWDVIFSHEGARWFHTGGVMCALSPQAPEVIREAMMAAKRHGVIVSYDCNYRPSLWKQTGGRLAACNANRTLAPFVDVLFGHEGDLSVVLCESSQQPPWHSKESYAAMAHRLIQQFENIRIIATTARRVITANRNDWAAFSYAEGKIFQSIEFAGLEILDRVGAGDSFASGFIYGLIEDKGLQWSLDCGVAHGALTMATLGDSSMASFAEVETLMQGGSAAVQR
jgi:2-dehydro-3-deoxygluconokinase